ncbi:MAG: DNA polymerase III subunit beta [Christensenellaceae bacterium]|jgi:DNA polymerase-3 subunit beta|nr:DNA polymerase III subunit beta [Christensenellaceae bacterium]
MKFSCEGTDLISAVNTVARIGGGGRLINPILEGIKVLAKDGKVTFFATDLEMYIRKTIKADIKEEGQVVLPGKLLGEYVNKIGTGKITLTSQGDNCILEHGNNNRGSFSLFLLEEYPDLINLTTKPMFSILGGDLKELISKTTIFASTDGARPILKGVLFEIEQGKLTSVALDGFRLGRVENVIKVYGDVGRIVVPARSLEEVKKLIVDEKEDINVIVENKFMQIEIGPITFATRLIDGEFVNYKQVIPKDFPSNIVVERKAFASSVGRTRVFGVNENKVNLVELSISDKKVEISSMSERGGGNEVIDGNLTGHDIKISFDSNYLFDALNIIEDEFIKFSYSSPLSPCVITNTKPDNYLFLVLPLKTN